MTRTEEILMWERCCPEIDREEIERIVDELRYDEERREEEKPKLRVVSIKDRDEYHEYLQSPEWRLVKNLVWSRDRGECRDCGTAEHLQVHHLSYEYLGREWQRLSTVILLCRWCHEERHRKDW